MKQIDKVSLPKTHFPDKGLAEVRANKVMNQKGMVKPFEGFEFGEKYTGDLFLKEFTEDEYNFHLTVYDLSQEED